MTLLFHNMSSSFCPTSTKNFWNHYSPPSQKKKKRKTHLRDNLCFINKEFTFYIQISYNMIIKGIYFPWDNCTLNVFFWSFLPSCATCLLARRRWRRCPPWPAGPGACRTPGWCPASSQSPGRRSGWCGRGAARQTGRKPSLHSHEIHLLKQKNQRFNK